MPRDEDRISRPQDPSAGPSTGVPLSLERRFVLLSALRWLPLGLLLPLFVLVPTARGLGLAAIGAIAAAHGITAAVLELPTGALADGLGRRRTLVAGGVTMTGALAVFAFATTLGGFVVAEALLAAGRALISGSLEAWFVDALREHPPAADLRRPLSRSAVAASGALAVGSLIAGVVPLAFAGLPASGDAAFIVYTPVVLLAVACTAAYTVSVALLVDEPGRPRGAAALRALPAALRTVTGTAAGQVRHHPTVRVLLVTAMGVGVVLTALETLWQPRLSALIGGAHGRTWVFGVLSAVALGATAAGAALAPSLARRLGSGPRAYAAGLAGGAAALVALALAGVPAAFALAYVAVYGPVGVMDPLHAELLHDAAEARARATMVSVDSLALQAGGVAGALTLPALAGAVSIAAAWGVAAAVALAAALLVLRVRPVSSEQLGEDRGGGVGAGHLEHHASFAALEAHGQKRTAGRLGGDGGRELALDGGRVDEREPLAAVDPRAGDECPPGER